MKKHFFYCLIITFFMFGSARAQIDIDNVDLQRLIGEIMQVKRGWAPQFSLGKTPIENLSKVAEILNLKSNEDVNRLFKTFRTGRTVYQIAAYAGGAIAMYGIARKLGNTTHGSDFNAALFSGLGSIASGVVVKLLTKGAAYEAINIFNGIAVKTIKDIISIKPASGTMGVGIYVRLG